MSFAVPQRHAAVRRRTKLRFIAPAQTTRILVRGFAPGPDDLFAFTASPGNWVRGPRSGPKVASKFMTAFRAAPDRI